MAVQYLRGLCQNNEFVGDGFELMGHKLHIKDVDVPLMAITCETDHIARWKDCYHGVQQMGSRSKSFIVSESGHIAGIVNPPQQEEVRPLHQRRPEGRQRGLDGRRGIPRGLLVAALE